MVSSEGRKSLSPKQVDKLIESLVVLIDTREKENKHLTKYFDSLNIPYIPHTFSYGDYSFMIPANEELGITQDEYFDNRICIERKRNLEEISRNVSKYRERFKRELEKAKGTEFVILIENSCYDQIVKGDYDTKISPQSFVASLAAFKYRYGIRVEYVRSNVYSGNFMMVEFRAYLKEWLKNETQTRN